MANALPQLTQNKAIEFARSNFARTWNANHIAWFQINQRLLCVDLKMFQQALSIVLQSPIYTHELSSKKTSEILCKVSDSIPDHDKKFVENFLNTFLGLEETKVRRD